MSVRRHTFYNLAGHGLSLIVLLATIPIYIDVIGVERYGVLSVIWLLLGYFGFFDFGIGRAVAHQVAACTENNPEEKRHAILWTALLTAIPLSLLGAAILYFAVAYALENWVQMPTGLRAEAEQTLIWVSLSLILLLLAGVFGGAMTGMRRFLEINVLGVGTKLLLQVMPLGAALLLSPDLGNLAMAVFFARLLSLVSWGGICYKIMPYALSPKWRRGLVGGLWRYGGWITVSGVVGPILSGMERLLIGTLIGASAVTFYAVPYSLISPVTVLAGSLGAALFPLFAACSGERNRYLEARAAGVVLAVVTPLLVALAFIIQPFLGIWIDADFSREAGMVPQILILGFWANSIAIIAHSRLQGSGQPRAVALIHLAEILPYLLLLFVLVAEFGIVGAAIAWAARVIADALLLGGRSGLLSGFGAKLWIPFVIVLLSVFLALALAANPWAMGIVGCIMMTMAVWWAWRIGLDEEARVLVARIVRFGGVK